MQIRALHHVTLWSEDAAATSRALERPLGLSKVGEVGPLVEYRGDNNPAQAVYIRSVQGFWPGAEGAGAIHHVAFRANDPAALDTALGVVIDDGLNVSDVREHGYFQSLYFREPGGSLIELATDRPGFTLDEPVERLGEALTLPPEWEPRRREIEAALPTFELPGRPRPTWADLGWIHRFERGAGPRTLLLLHGTGADETQLLEVGRRLAPEAHLLAVRGRSLEEGSPRYFRRYSATTYDQAHLLSEAEALTRFVDDAAPIYGFDPGDVVSVGYSNGANIALAALSHWPTAFAGAVLLRPVMVMEQPPAHDLSGLSVLVLEGRRDPFLPFGRAVVPYLQERGARVRAERLDAGHELTDTDLTLAGEWLAAFGSES
jgi:phospholipase/carboxylesterase